MLLTTATAFGQVSTTATVRGTVEDSSGGVLPGATVTLTNTGTKAVQTAVTDDRGQYQFGGLFPGTYDLKVELSGFKTYEQKALALSPNDTRGIDVRLEVGAADRDDHRHRAAGSAFRRRRALAKAFSPPSRSTTCRSSAAARSSCCASCPASSPTSTSARALGGGANNTQNYTVNGIRSSGNTAQLDGSNLLDIGCNCGMMVSLNNDMVSEVKVQSSNFAAEYGAGGMNVSGVTKAGSSKFHGELYDYSRDSQFAANDRSNCIAGVAKPKSTYQYPGGNVGGPIFFGDSYTKNKDKLFFFVAYEAQRQQVDSGSALHAHVHRRDEERRLQRAARQPRLEPEQHSAAAASRRDSRTRASPAPNNDMTPYMTAARPVPGEPVSGCRTTTTRPTCTTTSTARSSRRTATTSSRGSTGTSATAPRPTCASRASRPTSRARAACGGRRPTSRCPRRTSDQQLGQLVRRQRGLGAQPVDDQRGASSATAG